MDYQLENLGPDRFQEVCQAILVKSFPRTQCFPIGQRDGGRDAVTYIISDGRPELIVWQMKFVRNPDTIQNPHKWLVAILQDELHKIKALIPKGASRYYILTNVRGTGSLENGSIDKLNEVLASTLEIPSECWWRDDLNRRLDDSWDIKWEYPDIMSGTDMLRYIIEHGLSSGDAQRALSVVKMFVRDQYERDKDVRFKQVELQNRLLDLFIDIPISLDSVISINQLRREEYIAIETVVSESRIKSDKESYKSYSDKLVVGVAEFLLHPMIQKNIRRIVIEGAPGQGKSTVAQYICQVYRKRLLDNYSISSGSLNSKGRPSLRLPFKIDCRDFSSWLSGEDPFSIVEADCRLPVQRSLESFLVMQVTLHAGGVSFSSSDLISILQISSILLVFDGLDEVADIGRRRDVIDNINKGVDRLSEVAASMQVVVTSRPAAFANSPGMPERLYRTLSLMHLNRDLIVMYAEKWLRVRGIEGKDASDIRRILSNKIDQPHLRELSKNPMQLAILLSLIQTRGGSLPDKRTALYDSYVELFFNRESEKSTIVRDHRDLLIDIHRYLAWILHSESQTKMNPGSVSLSQLRALVASYLINEGHDSDILDALFSGMVERVVALVSRVEGTYEFEVQPLREYFAARHLYCTAPYSPTGSECHGTLPDRFDAMSRDFFWLNVTRFYAGCYSKGELSSLIERLEELAKDHSYKYTFHPRALAATLLADWVFAQHPKLMRRVVALILGGIGLRCFGGVRQSYRREDPLILPRMSGKEELLDHAFEKLASGVKWDDQAILVDLIHANSTEDERFGRWITILVQTPEKEKTQWIALGSQLGVVRCLSVDELNSVLSASNEVGTRLVTLLVGGQRQFVLDDPVRVELVLKQLLEGDGRLPSRSRQSVMEAMVQILSPSRYEWVFERPGVGSIQAFWKHMFGTRVVDGVPEYDSIPSGPVGQKCKRIVDIGLSLSEKTADEWATSLSPWSTLVESARSEFGETWLIVLLANTAAGIKAAAETCDDASNFFDHSVDLCRRFRYARRRAGVPSWWEQNLKQTDESVSLNSLLLVLFFWGGASVFERHFKLIDERVKSLSDDDWRRLYDGLIARGMGLLEERRKLEINADDLPDGVSERSVIMLCTRANEFSEERLFNRYLKAYAGSDPYVLSACLRFALFAVRRDPSNWQFWLPIIARSYSHGATVDRYFGYRFSQVVRHFELPRDVAESIVEGCELYPRELVIWAEEVCRDRVMREVVPVGIVAERERWF